MSPVHNGDRVPRSAAEGLQITHLKLQLQMYLNKLLILVTLLKRNFVPTQNSQSEKKEFNGNQFVKLWYKGVS